MPRVDRDWRYWRYWRWAARRMWITLSTPLRLLLFVEWDDRRWWDATAHVMSFLTGGLEVMKKGIDEFAATSGTPWYGERLEVMKSKIIMGFFAGSRRDIDSWYEKASTFSYDLTDILRVSSILGDGSRHGTSEFALYPSREGSFKICSKIDVNLAFQNLFNSAGKCHQPRTPTPCLHPIKP